MGPFRSRKRKRKSLTHSKKNAQKLAMFTRGKAMSTTPIYSGTKTKNLKGVTSA